MGLYTAIENFAAQFEIGTRKGAKSGKLFLNGVFIVFYFNVVSCRGAMAD